MESDGGWVGEWGPWLKREREIVAVVTIGTRKIQARTQVSKEKNKLVQRADVSSEE